jgi:hypothetical protein
LDTNKYYDLDIPAIYKCISLDQLGLYGYLFNNQECYEHPVTDVGLGDAIFGFLYRFLGNGTVNLRQNDRELLIYYKMFAGNRIIVEHVEEA